MIKPKYNDYVERTVNVAKKIAQNVIPITA